MKCYPVLQKKLIRNFKLEKTEIASVKSQNQIPQKDSVPASKATENQQVIVNRTSNNVTEGIKTFSKYTKFLDNECFRTEQSCPKEP